MSEHGKSASRRETYSVWGAKGRHFGRLKLLHRRKWFSIKLWVAFGTRGFYVER